MRLYIYINYSDITQLNQGIKDFVHFQRETKFAQATFSVQGTLLWNSLPAELKIQTELNIFCSRHLNKWFKQKHVCEQ